MSHLQRFTHFCKINNISKKEIEQKANLAQPKVYRYMNGETKYPRLDFVNSIAKGFPNLSLRWWILGEGQMKSDNQVPEDSVIIKKKELESKNQQILELQQKIINFTDDNELVKRIKELEAWKKETESQIPILYGNIEKLTEIIGKIQETYDEMSE